MECGNCSATLGEREFSGRVYPFCPGCRSYWTDERLALVQRYRRPPPAGSIVSLLWEPNGTQHGDMVLRVGTWARRGDSYYYVLDHPVAERASVRCSLRRMLQGWRAQIRDCPQHGVTYLPHGFFDQSTTWMRCRRQDELFFVEDGTSAIQGFAIYPSEYLEAAATLNDFQVDPDFGEPVSLPTSKLLRDIDASLDDLDDLPIGAP